MNQELLNTDNLIELKFGSSKLTINPQGNRIENLNLGGKEIFWKGTRPDGSNASSHLSVPWFGPYKAKLPKGVENPGYHGPGRKDLWNVTLHNPEKAITTLKVKELDQIYPNLDIFSTITLDHNMFTQMLTFHNKSSDAQPHISPGLHWYWNVPSKKAGEVIVNGVATPQEKWLEAEIIEAQEENKIVIPDLGIFKIRQTGFSKIILWTQKDADFLCIEIGHDPADIDQIPVLEPNSYSHMSATISIL